VGDGASLLMVGCGAMGGVIAAQLEGHVGRLAVLDAAPAHVARLRDPGLRIEAPRGERTVAFDAYADAGELEGRFDFALVTVKAPHIEAALSPLVAADLVDAYVSLGNGLVQDRVAAVVGAERMIGGVMEFGSINVGPGQIRQTSEGGAVAVGEMDGEVRERTRRLVASLGAVEGIELVPRIADRIWSKVLINVTLSGLCALAGQRSGAFAADPHGRAAALAVWSEAYAAAIANGAAPGRNFELEARDLVPGEVGRELAEERMQAVLERSNRAKPSMLQDLEAGRVTEVDAINGAVAARARLVGVPAPANERVAELVHEIEAGRRESSLDLLADVATAAAVSARPDS